MDNTNNNLISNHMYLTMNFALNFSKFINYYSYISLRVFLDETSRKIIVNNLLNAIYLYDNAVKILDSNINDASLMYNITGHSFFYQDNISKLKKFLTKFPEINDEDFRNILKYIYNNMNDIIYILRESIKIAINFYPNKDDLYDSFQELFSYISNMSNMVNETYIRNNLQKNPNFIDVIKQEIVKFYKNVTDQEVLEIIENRLKFQDFIKQYNTKSIRRNSSIANSIITNLDILLTDNVFIASFPGIEKLLENYQKNFMKFVFNEKDFEKKKDTNFDKSDNEPSCDSDSEERSEYQDDDKQEIKNIRDSENRPKTFLSMSNIYKKMQENPEFKESNEEKDKEIQEDKNQKKNLDTENEQEKTNNQNNNFSKFFRNNNDDNNQKNDKKDNSMSHF